MKPIKPYLTVSVWQIGTSDYAVRGYRRGISVQVARCDDLIEALSVALTTPRKQPAVSVVPSAEIGVVTAPAPGTPSDQQNKAETVVTKDATGQVSTIPDRAISEMAALEAIRGERKQHALQFPESGDEELDHGNRMFRAGLSHAFSVVRALPDFLSSAPFNRPDTGGVA
ncbi:hypothetical protein [Paracoccus sp. IB05]|uniref:hypothetical protein n=1 Tax=Paracoccus sp. IB05 TaxID=2779367 RepID=UPI0018E8083F|nr:hypothetical protein [Paracoccus sp. IB05]MBJ2153983.1 hypothetical protein [Paracoccus sp. IB05]